MSTEVKVPVLGESITEATLGEWLKKTGDTCVFQTEDDMTYIERNDLVFSLVHTKVCSPMTDVPDDQLDDLSDIPFLVQSDSFSTKTESTRYRRDDDNATQGIALRIRISLHNR